MDVALPLFSGRFRSTSELELELIWSTSDMLKESIKSTKAGLGYGLVPENYGEDQRTRKIDLFNAWI